MQIHPRFRLNGKTFSLSTLSDFAEHWIHSNEEWQKAIGDFLLQWLGDTQTITVTTSGSTGVPKSIQLKKEAMVNSALATGTYFGLKAGNTSLLCLSAGYIAGKMMLVRAMVLGLEIDVVAPSSAPLESLNKNYHFAAMVPLQARNSINSLEKTKTLIIGGAPISNELREKLKKIPTSVFETYGMTETITHIAVKPISGVNVSNCFQTLPGVTISKDKRGCLIVNAPKIAKKSVITNDLVELIKADEFKWLGRIDNVINSGGVKLIPEQIESKLSKLIKERFFVTGIPDETLGEKLVVVVEGEDIDKNSLLIDIQKVSSLKIYEKPKALFVQESFIETPSGKVNRTKIKALLLKT